MYTVRYNYLEYGTENDFSNIKQIVEFKLSILLNHVYF